MKIEIDENGSLVLKEVYSGVCLETAEGNRIGIAMRDDTFEISVIGDNGACRWYRVNQKTGDIEKFAERSDNHRHSHQDAV